MKITTLVSALVVSVSFASLVACTSPIATTVQPAPSVEQDEDEETKTAKASAEDEDETSDERAGFGSSAVDAGAAEPEKKDASAPPPAPACRAPNHWSTASCNTCMGSQCCEEDVACKNDATCAAFLSCFGDCTTSSCQSSCVRAYPAGAEKAVALASCMGDHCETACGN